MKTLFLGVQALFAFTLISCQKQLNEENSEARTETTKAASTSTAKSISKGLIAYFPFTGNAKDASENGNDGVADGAILTTDRNGKKNNAYYFDGINYHKIIVSNPKPAVSLAGDFTISCWFNSYTMYDAVGTVRSLVLKMGDGVGSQDGYVFALFASTNTDASTAVVHFSAYSAPPSTQEDTYPRAIGYVNINTWYHAAVTYTKSTGELKYFLNGNLIDSRIIFFNIAENTNPLTIGSQLSIYNTVKTFHGKIDEVRLYNRALNASEISLLSR